MLQICFFFIVTLAFSITSCLTFFLFRQRKSQLLEIKRLTLQLEEMERKVEKQTAYIESIENAETKTEEHLKKEKKENGRASNQEGLSAMTDEELFHYMDAVISQEKPFLQNTFGRKQVMERFSISAVRVGAAFTQGGAMGLPEYVRNHRLDHACGLIVEEREMTFAEIAKKSGYLRVTTFYHDFKARFGITPTEYRDHNARPL